LSLTGHGNCRQPAQDRKLAFDDAGLGLQMHPVILEKDFWVSWLLNLLLAQPDA